MPTHALQAVGGVSESCEARECRVYERHSCDLPSRCQPASSFGRDDLKWSASMENISQGGVCLLLSRRFEPGTGLAIELPEAGSEETYVVLAKVVRVERQEGSGWKLGCEFVSELSEDELARLVHNSTAEKEDVSAENQPRLVGQVCLQLEVGTGTAVFCVLKNVAALNRWPLPPGSLAKLAGKSKSAETWSLTVKVRKCTSRTGGWDLEGTLVNNISRADLGKALAYLIRKN